MILLEYQNIKIFYNRLHSKLVGRSVIKTVKNTVPWIYVINDLNGEEIVGTFYGKEFQKTNQKEFKILINYMWDGRDIIIYLIAG